MLNYAIIARLIQRSKVLFNVRTKQLYRGATQSYRGVELGPEEPNTLRTVRDGVTPIRLTFSKGG